MIASLAYYQKKKVVQSEEVPNVYEDARQYVSKNISNENLELRYF